MAHRQPKVPSSRRCTDRPRLGNLPERNGSPATVPRLALATHGPIASAARWLGSHKAAASGMLRHIALSHPQPVQRRQPRSNPVLGAQLDGDLQRGHVSVGRRTLAASENGSRYSAIPSSEIVVRMALGSESLKKISVSCSDHRLAGLGTQRLPGLSHPSYPSVTALRDTIASINEDNLAASPDGGCAHSSAEAEPSHGQKKVTRLAHSQGFEQASREWRCLDEAIRVVSQCQAACRNRQCRSGLYDAAAPSGCSKANKLRQSVRRRWDCGPADTMVG